MPGTTAKTVTVCYELHRRALGRTRPARQTPAGIAAGRYADRSRLSDVFLHEAGHAAVRHPPEHRGSGRGGRCRRSVRDLASCCSFEKADARRLILGSRLPIQGRGLAAPTVTMPLRPKFADEHGTPRASDYLLDLLCMAYGADPASCTPMSSGPRTSLPKDRAEGCRGSSTVARGQRHCRELDRPLRSISRLARQAAPRGGCRR